jgi:membrane fusion protein, peptide pheromone/bacteriocin exporter
MNIPTIDPDFCIEKQIFRHNRKSRTIYLVVAFTVFAGLLSLPFLKVDIVVHGIGIVRPVAEKVTLLSPVDQTIVRILAHEGKRMAAGDTLLLLNSVAIDADRLYQKGLLTDMEHQLTDLMVLCRNRQPTTFRSDKRCQESVLHQRQIEELKLNLESAAQKLRRNLPLYETGIIPMDEYENYRYEKQRCERALKTLQENQISLWKADLNNLLQQRLETVTQLKRLQQEKRLYAVTAPIQGTLEEFTALYEGGNLTLGQTLGFISPDSTLFIESYVQPEDIGYLQAGMPVKVLAEAFNYNQWGMLSGRVSAISSDFVMVDNKACYKVKCSIERPFLSLKNGRKGFLKKGMTVQTRFLVNRRSIFQLLYEKMDDWINPANYATPS